jgi:hypothetical protein
MSFGPNLKQKLVEKNTFLEVVDDAEEEDLWTVPATCRRQLTDSIMDMPSHFRYSPQVEQGKPESKQECTETGTGSLQSSPVLSSQPSGLASSSGCLPEAADEESEGGEDEIQTTSSQNPVNEEASEEADTEKSLPSSKAEEAAIADYLSERGKPSTSPIADGVKGCTTVMIRNLPCRYTQEELMREINGNGFQGTFDFIYVPMATRGHANSRSHANRGIGFVNFISAETAERFYETYHEKQLRFFESSKAVKIVSAHVQGFDANAELCMSALKKKPAQQPPHHHVQSCGAGVAGELGQSFALEAGAIAATGFFGPGADPRAASANDMVPRYCPYCGKAKEPDHRFCPYCGME